MVTLAGPKPSGIMRITFGASSGAGASGTVCAGAGPAKSRQRTRAVQNGRTAETRRDAGSKWNVDERTGMYRKLVC
jgi:hypothetical protein